jgi:hypothetical protein
VNAKRPDDDLWPAPPPGFGTSAKPPKLPIHHDPAHALMHSMCCKSAARIFEVNLEERKAAIAAAGDVKARLMAQGFVAVIEVEIAHEKEESELYALLARDPAALLRRLAKRGAR